MLIPNPIRLHDNLSSESQLQFVEDTYQHFFLFLSDQSKIILKTMALVMQVSHYNKLVVYSEKIESFAPFVFCTKGATISNFIP